jgi:pimeloyl-ACP methyl ester carboxylesterase
MDVLHHGGSTSTNFQATLIDNAQAIHSLIDNLEIKDVIILGHSLGGPVMLELSRLIDPSKIKRLISVDSLLPEKGSNFDGNSPEQIRDLLAPFETDFSANFGRAIEYWLENVPVESDKELVRQGMRNIMTKGVLAVMEDMGRWNVFEGLLRANDLPLCGIFAGETVRVEARPSYDLYFPALYLEGCRHYLMLEKPEGVNLLLEQLIEKLT